MAGDLSPVVCFPFLMRGPKSAVRHPLVTSERHSSRPKLASKYDNSLTKRGLKSPPVLMISSDPGIGIGARGRQSCPLVP